MAETTAAVRPRPERNPIVVDLQDRRITAGDHERALPSGAPTTDQVLAAYLALVYAMRHAAPGSAVPLRGGDLEVLSRALALAVPEVTERLHDLMAPTSGAGVDAAGPSRGTRRSTKLLVGGLAVLAAAGLAVGGVVVAQQRRPVPVDVSSAQIDPASYAPVQLAPAQVLTRDGVQQDRTADPATVPTTTR